MIFRCSGGGGCGRAAAHGAAGVGPLTVSARGAVGGLGAASVGGGSGSADAGESERVPGDIPDGSDDDIVARQLREAAMNEDDPELRERLWEEYRAYKSGRRAQGGRGDAEGGTR
ncbi:MAG: hypothetical protein AAFX50_23930 [Acidobacteriota bacterium]